MYFGVRKGFVLKNKNNKRKRGGKKEMCCCQLITGCSVKNAWLGNSVWFYNWFVSRSKLTAGHGLPV